MLSVLDPAQLHVLLPIFVNDGNQSPNSDPINASRTHSMQTRLQTAAFYGSLPELQSLTHDDDSLCYNGFSFVDEIVDPKEPKSFKVTTTNSKWQNAMQDEFDALKGQ